MEKEKVKVREGGIPVFVGEGVMLGGGEEEKPSKKDDLDHAFFQEYEPDESEEPHQPPLDFNLSQQLKSNEGEAKK